MGGLKKHLPITYWTFIIGSLAIAGIPPLAGFFSKDEILFETFYRGYQWLWVVGVVTSLLTATYMWRLVHLTFHGRAERFGARTSRLPTRTTIRTCTMRRRRWRPPVALAIGSVLRGGWVVPHALGGHNQFGTLASSRRSRPRLRWLA